MRRDTRIIILPSGYKLIKLLTSTKKIISWHPFLRVVKMGKARITNLKGPSFRYVFSSYQYPFRWPLSLWSASQSQNVTQVMGLNQRHCPNIGGFSLTHYYGNTAECGSVPLPPNYNFDPTNLLSEFTEAQVSDGILTVTVFWGDICLFCILETFETWVL